MVFLKQIVDYCQAIPSSLNMKHVYYINIFHNKNDYSTQFIREAIHLKMMCSLRSGTVTIKK